MCSTRWVKPRSPPVLATKTPIAFAHKTKRGHTPPEIGHRDPGEPARAAAGALRAPGARDRPPPRAHPLAVPLLGKFKLYHTVQLQLQR